MLAAALTHIETGACPVVAKETANRAPSMQKAVLDDSLNISQPFHPMRNSMVDIKVKEQ